MNNRNPYIISKAMNSFLVSSLLSMIIVVANQTIDAIIMSHCIGPQALSAINLFSPVMMVLVTVSTLFCFGASYMTSKHLGENKTSQVYSAFASTILAIISISTFILLVSVFCKNTLLSLLSQSANLRSMLSDYASVFLYMPFLPIFSMFCSMLTQAHGNPKLVTKVAVCTMLLNALLDIFFVKYLAMGIAGSAWATQCCYVVNIAILWYFLRNKYKGVFRHYNSYLSIGEFKDCVREGIPTSLATLVPAAIIFFINAIIQEKQGDNGLLAISVCLSTLSFSTLIASGFNATIGAVGAYLMAQKDYLGIRFLLSSSSKKLALGVMSLFAICLLFPQVFTFLYGVEDPQQAIYVQHSIRLFCWLMPFYVCSMFFSRVFQLSGHVKISATGSLLMPATLFPTIFAVTSIWGDAAVWYSFPASGVCIIVILILLSAKITLVPKSSTINCLDISVGGNSNSFNQSLQQIQTFLQQLNIDYELSNNVNHCLEEYMLNIIQHGHQSQHSSYSFDVRLCYIDQHIYAYISDNGIPFNPLTLDVEKEKIGLTITRTLCNNIQYKYMYGLNLTCFTW